MDATTILFLAACAVAVFAALWRTSDRPRTQRRKSFVKRDSLLTPAELRFYRVLLKAVPSGVSVFVKVRVLDILDVEARAWREYGAPASGMHVDFVIADAATAVPLLAVELDDKSHALPKAKKRDAFKDSAFASAEVPLLRITAARRYSEADLRARIQAVRGREREDS